MYLRQTQIKRTGNRDDLFRLTLKEDVNREKWTKRMGNEKMNRLQASGNLWSSRQHSAAEAAVLTLFLKVLLFLEDHG